MMSPQILSGPAELFSNSFALFSNQPVDEVRTAPAGWQPAKCQTTIAGEFSVTGPSTYHKGNQSTLTVKPCEQPGWHFRRTDLPMEIPIAVQALNVVDCNRNLELSCGGRNNNVRMTEHIIALRHGLGVDNVLIETNSDDPPLFDVGSEPLVAAFQKSGIQEIADKPRRFLTVREPVAIVKPSGAFLLYEPAEGEDRLLHFDVAIDFQTAIGQQRIQFDLTPEVFAYGAQARTNCSGKEMFLMRTIGKLFSKYRNFGYTNKNILIAGKKKYKNTPALFHDGKSLEAVWHRACLDLIAALALAGPDCLAGRITSYKAGHAIDNQFVNLLLNQKLLQPI